MNLKTLEDVTQSLLAGKVDPGWRLARLSRVRTLGESSLYWAILSSVSDSSVIQAFLSCSCRERKVRRAMMTLNGKVLAMTEVI